MLAKVALQCPFASATCILGEKGTNLISNTKMVLVSQPPNIITIIPFKGRLDHIGVWNPTSFVNTCHHKSCHDLVFYEPLFLHLGLVHIMLCHGCG
jgi:hypothetical protein